MGHSCKKSSQLIMMIKLSILSILLFSLVSSTPLPTKEQEEQARGLLEDIIIGQINNLLGITTTRGTPILDLAGGLLGVETTTSPPQPHLQQQQQQGVGVSWAVVFSARLGD